jgi:hypothetical protein
MRTKTFLSVLCLSLALCTQVFGGDDAPQSACRRVRVRGWLKAVFTFPHKGANSSPDTPAPKDAPKTDAAPPSPAPAANKAT